MRLIVKSIVAVILVLLAVAIDTKVAVGLQIPPTQVPKVPPSAERSHTPQPDKPVEQPKSYKEENK